MPIKKKNRDLFEKCDVLDAQDLSDPKAQRDMQVLLRRVERYEKLAADLKSAAMSEVIKDIAGVPVGV